MEYFWKENKRFCIAVGGGLLFLLLYNGFVLGPLRRDASDAANRRIREKRDIEKKMAQGMPTDEGLLSGRRDRDQHRALLASKVPEVEFKLDKKYQRPKGQSVKTFYDDLKLDVLKELQQKAISGRVSFPQNVNLAVDVTDDTAAEVLARLAIVDRLTTIAVDSEIEKIETIDGEFNMDRDERSSKKSQFLTKYTVFAKVQGKAESIFKLVHAAQKKGSYLAVTHFEMGRPDATKDLFEVQIALSMLRVDDKAGLDAK